MKAEEKVFDELIDRLTFDEKIEKLLDKLKEVISEDYKELVEAEPIVYVKRMPPNGRLKLKEIKLVHWDTLMVLENGVYFCDGNSSTPRQIIRFDSFDDFIDDSYIWRAY